MEAQNIINVSNGGAYSRITKEAKEACNRVASKWEPFLQDGKENLVEIMLNDLMKYGVSVISNRPCQEAYYIGGLVKTKGVPPGNWISVVQLDGKVTFKVNGEKIDIY